MLTDRSHNDGAVVHSIDTLVGQDLGSVKTGLVLKLNILTGAGDVSNAAPGADGVLPADDGVGDKSERLDCGLGHDSCVSQTATSANDASLADNDVGSEHGGGINLSAGVNPDGAILCAGSDRSIVASLLNLGSDVHTLALDVVGGLTNVHPVAWKFHLVEVVGSGHDGEDLTLNRGGSVLNAVNDIDVEQVESSVDLVAHKGLRLLDEALDLAVLLGDDDTVAGGFLDTGHDNSALLAVVLVELDELLKGVLADDIGVENKEESGLVVLTDLGLSKLEGTSSAHRGILDGDGDLDAILKTHKQEKLR